MAFDFDSTFGILSGQPRPITRPDNSALLHMMRETVIHEDEEIMAANGKRISITIEFEVTLDQVPGVFDNAQDWVNLIQREFLNQKAYEPKAHVLSIDYGLKK
jgi:hypothetical protein